MQFLLWAFAIVNLFMVKILKPKPWWLAVFVSQGMLLGLTASAWYYRNLRRKAEICGVVRPLFCVFPSCPKACAGPGDVHVVQPQLKTQG